VTGYEVIPPLPFGAEPREARRWAAEHEPYAPPVVLPPIVRAVKVEPEIAYTRTGRVRGLAWPTLTACKMPSGANSAAKSIIGNPDLTLIVTYARGYPVNADGTQKRAIIWQENEPNMDDQRVRIQAGHKPPEAVDSVLVRGYQRDADGISRVLMGHWVDGSFENGCDYVRGSGITNLSATTFAARLKGDA
jgi:hypothetical protein